MGLTMSQRQAVTRENALRYREAGRTGKAVILDELCALTGWHRDHARKALRASLGPVPVRRRAQRRPLYGAEVIAALTFCWQVMCGPAGKRMAPFLPELVARLRMCGELDITDAVAAAPGTISAATIDRRMAGERKKLQVKDRSGTRPGSLLKSQIPIRTWSQWDDARPGFVEIDLVAHEGGDARGIYCQTLTMTDIATGATETRAVGSKARARVLVAVKALVKAMPLPVLGIDSDNGKEFINQQLLDFCLIRKITFTRSRPGNKNDSAYVEQKNWSVVRHAVGYARYDTPPTSNSSTSSTHCSGWKRTSLHRNRNWCPKSATAPRSPNATTPPRLPSSEPPRRTRSPAPTSRRSRVSTPNSTPPRYAATSPPSNTDSSPNPPPNTPTPQPPPRPGHHSLRQRLPLPGHLDMRQYEGLPT
jgi:hypothetical protein